MALTFDSIISGNDGDNGVVVMQNFTITTLSLESFRRKFNLQTLNCL